MRNGEWRRRSEAQIAARRGSNDRPGRLGPSEPLGLNVQAVVAAAATDPRDTQPMKCTHIALQVRDIERSIEFYRRYCGLCIVHDRRGDGVERVVWMSWGEDPPRFVIVLLAEAYERNVQPPSQHIGMAVDSRAEVDAIFAQAQADGLQDLWPPIDAGPIVGYYCGLPDPDGNRVEFSHGQRIG